MLLGIIAGSSSWRHNKQTNLLLSGLRPHLLVSVACIQIAMYQYSFTSIAKCHVHVAAKFECPWPRQFFITMIELEGNIYYTLHILHHSVVSHVTSSVQSRCSLWVFSQARKQGSKETRKQGSKEARDSSIYATLTQVSRMQYCAY